MIPGMNPKMMEKAMKKMGIKQENIEASEVIIKCPDKDLVFRNPSVSKVNAMGQETYQVVGDVEEVEAGVSDISDEDVKTVVEQTGVDEEKARESLTEHKGDIAKTILDLKNS
jgi:nascent polypeptide-associated complex subunit alpha